VDVLLISIDGFAGFYWDDPRARMPTLRRLAERGVVSPRMECVFPSTTWPTHVSLVTGALPARHGVVGNHVLNRRTLATEDLTGDPIYDAADLLRVPAVYDVAHAAGLRTAAIDWPATRRAASLDFNLPFFKDQRVFETQTAREVWSELVGLGFPMERQGEWAQLPRRFLKDAMVADVAAHVWRRHTPRLMLAHFLCVDSHQHLYGPRSPEAYWAIEYVDGLIGRLLGVVGDRATVLVVSDHGFLPVDREVRPNVRLRQLGVAAEARFVMNHGAGYVYALAERGREALLRDLSGELGRLPGVASVWTEAGYDALGLPARAESAWLGDLALEAAPGYYFADEAAGDEVVAAPRYRGTHGQRPTHPDNAAFFLAAGAPIVKGSALGAVKSRDVAPTVAALLGLGMSVPDGRVLDGVLAG
jgi:predicted AlkP superfamily pyrophosphatase or phosphodiesterase